MSILPWTEGPFFEWVVDGAGFLEYHAESDGHAPGEFPPEHGVGCSVGDLCGTHVWFGIRHIHIAGATAGGIGRARGVEQSAGKHWGKN